MAVAYSQNGVIVRGGNEVTIPDIGIDKYTFKNFFPFKLAYDSYTRINENLIYDGRAFSSGSPMLIPSEFKPKISDNFEIYITFKKPNGYSTSGRCLIGAYEGYYTNFTMETTGDYAWCGIPIGGSSWPTQLRFEYDSNLSSDKWYSLCLKQKSLGNTAILSYELYDETGLIKSISTTNYIIRPDLTQLQLGGTACSSSIHWTGNIDLKRTYISINDEILWGCNMPYNV